MSAAWIADAIQVRKVNLTGNIITKVVKTSVPAEVRLQCKLQCDQYLTLKVNVVLDSESVTSSVVSTDSIFGLVTKIASLIPSVIGAFGIMAALLSAILRKCSRRPEDDGLLQMEMR